MSENELSQYEAERLAKIERNKQMLAELGLSKPPAETLSSPTARVRKYKKRTFEGETKRSNRLIDKPKPVYNFAVAKKAKRAIEKLNLKKRAISRTKNRVLRDLAEKLKAQSRRLIQKKLTQEEIDALLKRAEDLSEPLLKKRKRELDEYIEKFESIAENGIEYDSKLDYFEIVDRLIEVPFEFSIQKFDIKNEILKVRGKKHHSKNSKNQEPKLQNDIRQTKNQNSQDEEDYNEELDSESELELLKQPCELIDKNRDPKLISKLTPYKQSRYNTRKLRICFTCINNWEEYIEAIEDLGGQVVDDIMTSTHLVAEKIVLTKKFLCAVAQAKHIMGLSWIHDSIHSKRFLDEYNYVLHDEAGELAYNFKLKESIKLALNVPIFQTKQFYLSPKLSNVKLIAEIIVSAGGQIIFHPEKSEKLIYIVVTQSDSSVISNFIHKIVDMEYIYSCILKQKCVDEGGDL